MNNTNTGNSKKFHVWNNTINATKIMRLLLGIALHSMDAGMAQIVLITGQIAIAFHTIPTCSLAHYTTALIFTFITSKLASACAKRYALRMRSKTPGTASALEPELRNPHHLTLSSSPVLICTQCRSPTPLLSHCMSPTPHPTTTQ